MKLMSYYLTDKILGHLFNIPPFDPPLVIGIALSRYNPGPSGYYLDEPPTDYNYSRIATYASWWEFDPVTITIGNNPNPIVFPEATGDWGTITHFALFDSANYGAGNMLFYGPMYVPREVTAGCIPRFDVHSLNANLM